jgi:aldehyde:ferredoxin oxidoreductase
MFPLVFFGNYPMLDYLNAATGWGMDMGEVLETGARIQTLRLCFNIREGINPLDIKLHSRMIGQPPMKEGPVADVTVDIDSLSTEYRKAMGWDGDTGHPKDETVEKLGLKGLVDSYG